MTDNRYLLDNANPVAGGRHAALAGTFDHVTFDHFDQLGVGAGWSCWEVGAGGPTVASWLAERVGPGGRVVATDIDTTWLTGLPANVTVARHDVGADPPPAGPFDLVHARLVLVHVVERDEALRRMVEVLRPGGWLLVEDFDPALLPDACLDPTTEAEHRANRIRAGFIDLLAKRGVDLMYGRKLPRLLRQAGLLDVGADAYFPVSKPATKELERVNTEQVRDGLVAAVHVTDADIDAHLRAVAAGDLDVASPPLISVAGRKPD